jgi:ion channel-forming bestrophin family protein
MDMSSVTHRSFWHEAIALHGSVTPRILPYVFAFGAYAAALCGAASWIERTWQKHIGLEVAPYEVAGAGAVLGLLLVFRTNAGYDRWWEARKLWGGIVNQSRNLAISALSYGPVGDGWTDSFIRWTAAFAHVARTSLRGEPVPPEVVALIGPSGAEQIAAAGHRPSFVARRLGFLLRDARERFQLDGFAFQQLDKERAALIDHIGACERILKTPLAKVYSIKIRRFIAIFLMTLPLALLHRTNSDWLVPIITMLVAYPLVSLDQIGIELQNPFSASNLSHLPLDDISNTVESNLLGLLRAESDLRDRV